MLHRHMCDRFGDDLPNKHVTIIDTFVMTAVQSCKLASSTQLFANIDHHHVGQLVIAEQCGKYLLVTHLKLTDLEVHASSTR